MTKKSPKKSNLGAGRPKSRKKQVILSRRVKNSFYKNRPVKLVDLTKKNQDWPVFSSKKVSLPKDSEKKVKIEVAANPLDNYFSPHCLDLSQVRFIERVKPAARPAAAVGEEFLAKLYLFELFSLVETEFLSGIQRKIQKKRVSLKSFFRPLDLSPKLPARKNSRLLTEKNRSLWEEVVLINLIFFLGSLAFRAVEGIICLKRYFWNSRRFRPWLTDEVVEFNLRNFSGFGGAFSSASKKSAVQAIQRFGWDRIKNFFKSFTRPRPLKKPEFHWELISIRQLVGFAIIGLLLIAPLKVFTYWQEIQETKGAVLGQARQGLASLESAKSELAVFDLKSAESDFSSANQKFTSARTQLGEIQSFLTAAVGALPIANSFRSGKNVLELGEIVSAAGRRLAKAAEQLSRDGNSPLTVRLSEFQREIRIAAKELRLAEEKIKKIKISHLPEENRSGFQELQAQLPVLVSGLEELDGNLEFTRKFLGENRLKRYLLVFQNDNELRPSGGFLGSFALVDLVSGDIKEISLPAGGSYDVRAGMTETVAAPEPIRLINPRWEFQDANWWADWPTSAKKIAWFYNKSGGPTVDGVIAVNSDWLSELLKITGPLELEKYGKIVTAANFEREVQKTVELEHPDRTKPKEILGDLAARLLNEVSAIEPPKFLDFFGAISRGLKVKDIMIYLSDSELQQTVVENRWGGRRLDTSKDYFKVVAANVGGGKTDEAINQKIFHRAEIAPDGTVIGELLIRRRHFGPIEENFTNQLNRSYFRVYLPAGSRLIKAVGFDQPPVEQFAPIPDFLQPDPDLAAENLASLDYRSGTKIYLENGRTVFGNWLMVGPGETKEVLLTYQLPFKVQPVRRSKQISWSEKIQAAFSPAKEEKYDFYSLVIEKQPGSGSDEIVSQLNFPKDWLVKAGRPSENLVISGQETVFKTRLDQDRFYFLEFNN